MATKEVIIWESPADGWTLKQQNLNLHLAQSVVRADGTSDCNTVWQSKPIGPRRRTINWAPVYGLNWTIDLPAPGSGTRFTERGVWLLSAPGRAHDIAADGKWITSTVSGKAGYLTVGQNKYKPPGQRTLHILIGIQDPETGRFNAIYADPTPLAFNAGTSYRPMENLKFWYATGDQTHTMIRESGTVKGEVDMSAPNPTTNKYYMSATYLCEDETWEYSADPPPPIARTGLLGGATPGCSERCRASVRAT